MFTTILEEMNLATKVAELESTTLQTRTSALSRRGPRRQPNQMGTLLGHAQQVITGNLISGPNTHLDERQMVGGGPWLEMGMLVIRSSLEISARTVCWLMNLSTTTRRLVNAHGRL